MYKYKRIAAYLIDVAVMLVAVGFSLRVEVDQLAMLFVQGVAGFQAPSVDSVILTLLIPIGLYGAMTGYFGWTPGKLAMRLRVQGRDGGRVGIAKGILREAIKCVAFTCLIFGLVWALYDLFTDGTTFYDDWLSVSVEDDGSREEDEMTEVQRQWRASQGGDGDQG